MMQSGILEEAKLVYDHRDTYRTAAQAIGYKEFFRILREQQTWKVALRTSSRLPAIMPSVS